MGVIKKLVLYFINAIRHPVLFIAVIQGFAVFCSECGKPVLVFLGTKNTGYICFDCAHKELTKGESHDHS